MSAPEKPSSPAQQSSKSVGTARPSTARVVRQLIVMPFALVAILVFVWLFFSRLAHVNRTPRDLVRDLQKTSDDRWQKAYTLAVLLQDGRHDSLKDDAALCRQLAEMLTSEVGTATDDAEQIRLCVFLCRSLGQFRTVDGLAALAQAATGRDPEAHADVRVAALQAIAVLANRSGDQVRAARPQMVQIVLAASDSRDPYAPDDRQVTVRSAAVFALGVLGGPAATGRLATMLADAHPVVRYNAAAGLARYGDPRAIPVLLNMLAPRPSLAAAGEAGPADHASQRALIQKTGIRAAEQCARQVDSVTAEPLLDALRYLAGYPQLPQTVRLEAKETLLRLKTRSTSPANS